MSDRQKHDEFQQVLKPEESKSPIDKSNKKSINYSENWDRIRSILYDENRIPRKKIPKEDYKKLSNLVETINEQVVSAYLGNNRDVMANLVETGLFSLNFFAATLTPEKRAYFELGQLRGHISLMGRILSTMADRDRSLHLFDKFQKKFPYYAKDIILCIGKSGSIEKEELIKNIGNENLDNTIRSLVQSGFVYEKDYGNFDILFLTDTGRRVYYHYTSIKEDEPFYQH